MLNESDDDLSPFEQRTVEITFPLVPKAASRMLDSKQEFDYRERREEFAKWLLLEGKDTRDIEGYSQATAKRTMYRVSYFERAVWEKADEYVPVMTIEHANQYIEGLAYSDKSQSHKHHTLHALKRYFKWRHHEFGEPEWEPDRAFTVSNSQKPQDFFKEDERRKLRQTALEYGTIPSYKTVQTDEERRERLKPLVAEYHEKNVDDVGTDDWADIPSWKVTSLVWTSLDAGLRPVEVGNARTEWVDSDNAVLRIPKDESAKNEANWEVSLRRKTAKALTRWIQEREHYPEYDDTDALWLTQKKKPYDSKQLGRLLRKLCDIAGIDTTRRDVSWYSIRHSVGTYMTREEDLAATQAQLRHLRPETTMKYDAAPVSDRRDALDRMG
ncbi:site-specific integrase [Haloplanus salilacus]|uniref:tyrosine-type recombinase/integrase n=1 Tax=Haloplanus salilacus TaxID=2949994 RepID=UPI0030CAEA84